MEEVIPFIAVVSFGLAVLSLRSDKLTAVEERFLLFSFGVHVFSSLAIPWLFVEYMGGGDILGYAIHGRELANGMAQDFIGFTPEVLKLLFHLDGAYLENGTGGTSTGSMSAITAFPMLILDGSLYASSLVFSLSAFSGGIAMYRVFRAAFGEEYRTRLLWATLLVPSVVCWSSGLMKEAVVMGPLGWGVYAIHSFNEGKRLKGVVVGAICAVFIAEFKPYVLVPLVAAGTVWIYWHRATAGQDGRVPVLRPVYLVAAFFVAAAAVAALGAIFPEYAIDTMGEQTARYQALGELAGGGSVIEMGDSTNRSLVGQLAYAPMALVSSLFRPFIFEVKNVLMAMASIETSILFIIVVRTVWQRSWHKTWGMIWRSPLLMFSTAYTLLFGVAVGLVTLNLGTLSRYRMPLMPFYVALILIISKKQDAKDEVAESNGEDEAAVLVHTSRRRLQAVPGIDPSAVTARRVGRGSS